MSKKKKAGIKSVLANLADSTIEIFNPVKAARRRVLRMQQKAALPFLNARIGSARQTRLIDWQPPTYDANAAILPDLPKVRERARDAAINNPIYVAIRETLVHNVVGGTGLVPSSSVDYDRLGITQDQAKEWQAACDEVWRRRSKNADATGRSPSWASFLRLLYRSAFDGGDVFPSFPMRIWREGVGLQTRINLIEAERVSTPPARLSDSRVRGGVQNDEWGAPTGYWVSRSHPGDVNPKPRSASQQEHEFWSRTRRGRANILQVFQQERVGQSRGTPRLASVLDLLDQVEQYGDSTILAAEIQTRMGLAIVTDTDPNEWGDDMGPTPSERSKQYYERHGDGLEAGGFMVLQNGDDVKTIGSTAPSQYFDPFVIRLLRQVSAAVKVPFSLAFGDTTGANYSSMRAEREAFKRTIEVEQESLLPVCEQFWEHLIYDAWLDGELLPDAVWANPETNPDLLNAMWQRPTVGSVDPVKESRSNIDSINAMLKSPQQAIAETGGDWREVLKNLHDFEAERKRLGLSQPVTQRVEVDDMQGSPDSQEDPEDDETTVTEDDIEQVVRDTEEIEQ
jgi:lambda family phage portal protein